MTKSVTFSDDLSLLIERFDRRSHAAAPGSAAPFCWAPERTAPTALFCWSVPVPAMADEAFAA